MSAPRERRSRSPGSGRRSPPAVVDDLTRDFERISVNRGGKPETSSTAHHRQPPESPKGSVEEREGGSEEKADGARELSREDREMIRFKLVGRKKDFELLERVKGRTINILKGLELHTNVFSAAEQKRIVDLVYDVQEKGRRDELRERTYSEPRKWMRGKGRVTIQFGCCYNYAVDKNGNPSGIIRDELVDPLPPLLKTMIKRMVAWHVLPPTCVPNSCIINIYDEGDCIPPHIDHHDFVRPFCTVSFLSECNILFGTELKILGPGEFSGSIAIPLPLGSVLILSGNGADVAKHCVPAVPAKRISITFRKMDDSKLPYKFRPDPELQNLRPLEYRPPSQQVRIPSSSGQQQIGYHTPLSQVSVRQQGLLTPTSQVQHEGVQTPPFQFQEVHHPRHNENFKSQTQDKSGSSFRLGQHDFSPMDSSLGSGKTTMSVRPIRQ